MKGTVANSAVDGDFFVIARSAAPTLIVVVAVALLFAELGSVVDELIVAVFVIVAPVARAFEDATTSEKTDDEPAAKVAAVQFTVPVPPAAGFVQVNAGPLVCANDTNVVLAGTASVSATFVASEGPLLVAVIV